MVTKKQLEEALDKSYEAKDKYWEARKKYWKSWDKYLKLEEAFDEENGN